MGRGPVIAKATVSKVLQFDNLNPIKIKEILNKWPLVTYNWAKNKRYCTLIFLKNPHKIPPFKIDESGFGTGAAWMCVKDISRIWSLDFVAQRATLKEVIYDRGE